MRNHQEDSSVIRKLFHEKRTTLDYDRCNNLDSAEERQRYAQLRGQIQKAGQTKQLYIFSRFVEKHSDRNNTRDHFRLVRKVNKQFAPSIGNTK